MPTNVSDLLTISGLTTLTVLIMAILKRLDGPPGSWAETATNWIKANQFITSLLVAFTLAGLTYLVRETGYLPLAEKAWQGALFLWAVAQALYNGQKGLTHILRGEPN